MQNARITFHPTQQRMQMQVGILLADATNTLEVREHVYPSRHYFPPEDVRMDLLTIQETAAYYPFKGHVDYFCCMKAGALLGVIGDTIVKENHFEP